MAIVTEKRIRGALIRIHDDAYASCPAEEIARRRAERNRTAGQILIRTEREQAQKSS
ncbi:MAG: hypothetical protein J6K32_08205 [Clostridia bacterium]|nr:hypothetical protein [Clostridia bacterium]